MIKKEIAQKYSDKDCDMCKGIGIVTDSLGEEEYYCLCVTTNRKEKEAESLED